jgi:hypothetical protein
MKSWTLQRCSVRCRQRTGVLRSESKSPLTTADATTTANALSRPFQARRCSVRCHQRTKGCAALSDTIDHHDFSGVRPVVHVQNKTGPDRILADVIPFLAVRFVVSQNVIVKAGLPKRPQLLTGDRRRRQAVSEQCDIQTAFQSFDPFTEPQTASDSKADEEVNVVGHDDITADADVASGRAFAITNERSVDGLRGEHGLPQMGVERHEVKRRIVFLKHTLQPWRLSFASGEHATHCSVRCRPRTRTLVSDSKSPLTTADATTTANALSRPFQARRCRVRCRQRTEEVTP